jgi:hypothetical protein
MTLEYASQFQKWKRAKLLKPHLGQALHDLLDKAQGQAVTVDTIVKTLINFNNYINFISN